MNKTFKKLLILSTSALLMSVSGCGCSKKPAASSVAPESSSVAPESSSVTPKSSDNPSSSALPSSSAPKIKDEKECYDLTSKAYKNYLAYDGDLTYIGTAFEGKEVIISNYTYKKSTKEWCRYEYRKNDDEITEYDLEWFKKENQDYTYKYLDYDVEEDEYYEDKYYVATDAQAKYGMVCDHTINSSLLDLYDLSIIPHLKLSMDEFKSVNKLLSEEGAKLGFKNSMEYTLKDDGEKVESAFALIVDYEGMQITLNIKFNIDDATEKITHIYYDITMAQEETSMSLMSCDYDIKYEFTSDILNVKCEADKLPLEPKYQGLRVIPNLFTYNGNETGRTWLEIPKGASRKDVFEELTNRVRGLSTFSSFKFFTDAKHTKEIENIDSTKPLTDQELSDLEYQLWSTPIYYEPSDWATVGYKLNYNISVDYSKVDSKFADVFGPCFDYQLDLRDGNFVAYFDPQPNLAGIFYIDHYAYTDADEFNAVAKLNGAVYESGKAVPKTDAGTVFNIDIEYHPTYEDLMMSVLLPLG